MLAGGGSSVSSRSIRSQQVFVLAMVVASPFQSWECHRDMTRGDAGSSGIGGAGGRRERTSSSGGGRTHTHRNPVDEPVPARLATRPERGAVGSGPDGRSVL